MTDYTSLQVWVERDRGGTYAMVHQWALRADGVTFYRAYVLGARPGPWTEEGA